MNNKGRGEMAQSSQAKGKENMSVELSGETPPKTKKGDANNQEFKFPPKQYSLKDKQVVTIFHLLQKGNKLKLSKVRRLNEMGCTNDPNYCLFIGWFTFLPTNALSSRTKFRL